MGQPLPNSTVKCWIYRGTLRDQTYLYLAAEDDTKPVPDALLAQLGPLLLVMELDLSPQRTLANANPVQVMRSLDERGFYLQLPPTDAAGAQRLQ